MGETLPSAILILDDRASAIRDGREVSCFIFVSRKITNHRIPGRKWQLGACEENLEGKRGNGIRSVGCCLVVRIALRRGR